jgi:hypothetical protein
MNYIVLFDVTRDGYPPLWAVICGLLILALGIIGLILRYRSKFAAWFPLFLVLFAMLCITGILVSIGLGRYRLSSALRNGQCEVAEGVVTDFQPMPVEGHTDESFVVGGNRFEYSDYDLRPGFHQSLSHGGPIHPGLYVRVFHVRGEIARIEAAK